MIITKHFESLVIEVFTGFCRNKEDIIETQKY